MHGNGTRPEQPGADDAAAALPVGWGDAGGTGGASLAVGLAAILFAAVLFFIAIPHGITAPSNMREVVLSPRFWPTILAGLLAVCGIALVLSSRSVRFAARPTVAVGTAPGLAGPLRLGAVALVMVAYVALMPVVGLVLASMPAFLVTALLVRTRHRVLAAIASVAAPLVLYAFFAHVAGVAVPQGQFIRLP